MIGGSLGRSDSMLILRSTKRLCPITTFFFLFRRISARHPEVSQFCILHPNGTLEEKNGSVEIFLLPLNTVKTDFLFQNFFSTLWALPNHNGPKKNLSPKMRCRRAHARWFRVGCNWFQTGNDFCFFKSQMLGNVNKESGGKIRFQNRLRINDFNLKKIKLNLQDVVVSASTFGVKYSRLQLEGSPGFIW